MTNNYLKKGQKAAPKASFGRWLLFTSCILLFMVTILSPTQSKAQCTNATSFGSATINTSGTAVTISTCSYAEEYSPISGAVAGTTLRFTCTDLGGGAYITIHSGSSSGPVLAHGVSPLQYLNTFTGTIYAHWTIDAACNTNTGCRTTTVQFIPPPCVTPTLQPTALSLSAISGTQINGSFTASATADNYLVVRYLTGISPTNPVDGVSYTAGGALGSGVVVSSGTTTTFSATGLTNGAAYDFYIYALNKLCSGTTPMYLTTSPLTGTAPVPCTTPTTQPTNLVLTPLTTTSVGGSFTAASPTPTGYLVVRYPTGSAITNPTNGQTYIAGAALGLGTVVASTTGTTFTATGLTINVGYDFYVYAYNNFCIGTPPLYNVTAPITATAPLPCAMPAAQPTNLILTVNSTTSVGGTFTPTVPASSGYLVVRTLAGIAPTDPVDGTVYTAGNALGSGVVVASSTSTTFTASGLTASAGYDFYVYSYTNLCIGSSPLYRTASPLTAQAPLPCVTPATQPSSLVLSTLPFNTTTINGTFTAAAGPTNGYLVVVFPSAASVTNPVNGTTYTSGTVLGAGKVIQSSTALTFSATGLTASTSYTFYIYNFVIGCAGTPPIYNLVTPLSGIQSTTARAVPTCPTTFTPISGFTPTPVSQVLSWSGALADPAISGYDVYLDTSFSAVSGLLPSAKVASGQSGTSFTPSIATKLLAYNTTYYWLVVPINAVGASIGCSPLSFTTKVASGFTSTALGGLWNNATTWANGVVPALGDSVTIADGAVVTIDGAYTVSSLTIGQGGSGTSVLQFNGTANALSVIGDLTINSNGRFLPYSSAGTGTTVNVGGNFTNNGYTNMSIPSFLLRLNGSQVGGGSMNQILGGTGDFQGDGPSSGLVRSLFVETTGSSLISTSDSLIVTSGMTHTAGTLNTGTKLKIDNTRQLFTDAFNKQIASVAVTTMGLGYSPAIAPVVFGNAVTPVPTVAGTPSTINTVRYFSGDNVYEVVSNAINFNGTQPTHTSGLSNSAGPDLLYIGKLGTLGNPWTQLAPALGTQYFFGDNLYTAVATTVSATPPTHTGAGNVVGAYLWVGTAARVSVNFDATNAIMRSLTVESYGSGYVSAPTLVFTNNGGTPTTNPAATVVFFQSVLGTANSLTQKSGSAVFTPGSVITINSDQGVSNRTGVGAMSASNGGTNYTVAPLVGFSGPLALNLVATGGAGYTAAPTITVTGGTLVGGTALTTANFTITVNRGKVISVYLTGTAQYSVPPTLAFSGGTPTTAATLINAGNLVASGCWATATATINSNRQLNFAITNPGYGYNAAPTVSIGTTTGTATGGTFSTVASGISARVALYSLTFNNFNPSLTNSVNQEGPEVPVRRKLNNLSMSLPGAGAKFTGGNLELMATAPLTLSFGKVDMSGFNLLCSWNAYLGTSTSTLLTCIDNGSMTLTTKGGGTAGQTLSFPLDGAVTVNTSTGTGVTNGSSIETLTVSRLGKASGTANLFILGKRTTKLTVNSGAVYGAAPTVLLTYNDKDSLPQTLQQQYLFIAQSGALTGPTWTNRSVSSGTTTLIVPGGAAGSTRTTGTTAPNLFVPDPSGTDYLTWTSTFPAPVISNISLTDFCQGGGTTVTITGTGFTNVSAVNFNGTPATSYTVVSATSITAVSPSNVSAGVITVVANGSTASSVPYTVTASPLLTPTLDPANLLICTAGGSAKITLNNIGATSYTWTGAGLDTYTGLEVNATPPTSSVTYEVTATLPSGCLVKKSFLVGNLVVASSTPTATPASSCYAPGQSVSLNSNLSAGTFGVSVIPFDTATVPPTAASVYAAGTTQFPYSLGGSIDDGGWTGIPIGFSYNFFGQSFSTISAGTNGTLMFGPVPGYPSGTGFLGQYIFQTTNGLTFPNAANPGNVISLFSADMGNPKSSNFATTFIRYWTEGTAPTRRFVIEYKNWPNLSSATALNTVQCMLYETTGIVELHITNYTTTGTKTIGLQDGTKTIGAVPPGRQLFTGGITTPEAWRFVPPANYSYLWSPAANISDVTSGNPTYAVQAPGIVNLNLQITNPITGCVINKPVTFKSNAVPTAPAITGTLEVCGTGNTALFSSAPTAGNTIKWYDAPLAGTLKNTGTLFVTPTLSTATTYYVAQESNFCKSNRTPVTVTINQPPGFTVNDPTVCNNVTSAILRVTSNTNDFDTYVWTLAGASVANQYNNLYQDAALTVQYTGQNLAKVYAKMATAGSLKFYCNANSFTSLCSAKDSAIVTRQPASATVAVTAPGITSFCGSGNVTMLLSSATAVDSTHVNWFSSSDGINFLGAPVHAIRYSPGLLTDTTYYRIVLTDSTGATCFTVTPDIKIDVNNPQVATTTGANRCGTGSVTLQATAPIGTIKWYNQANVLVQTGGTSYTTPAIATTTTYSVSLTIGGCEGVKTPVIASVDLAIPITLTAPQIVCNNSIVPISVTSNLATYTSYTWDIDATLFTDNTTSNTYGGENLSTVYSNSVIPAQYTYTCHAENTSNGCVTTASTSVSVQPSALTQITSDPSCFNQPALLGLTNPVLGSPGTVQWFTSADNVAAYDSIIGATSATYTTGNLNVATIWFMANINDGSGALCFQADPYEHIVYNPLVENPLDGSRCGTGTVDLSASPSPGAALTWYTGPSITTGGVDTDNFTTPSITGTTTYYVEATLGLCKSAPRTAITATVTTPDPVNLTGAQTVCNGVAATISVIAPSGYTSYVWIPATGLYTSLSPDVAYVPGASATTVFAKTTTPGTITYRVNASNVSPLACVNSVTTTVTTNPASIAITATDMSLCRTGTSTLTLTPIAGFDFSNAIWLSSSDGVTFASIVPAATGSSYTTPTINQTTYYRAIIKNSAGDTCNVSNDLAITVNDPLVNTAVGSSRCGTGVMPALTATGSAGTTLNWYSALTGGTLKNSGSSYTPTLGSTTTYYIEAVIGSCASTPRTPVTATVSDPLPLTLNSNSQTVCNTDVVTLNVTSTNSNYDSYIWSPTTNLFEDNLGVTPYGGGSLATVYSISTTPGTITYTLSATNSVSQCADTAVSVVTRNPAAIEVKSSPDSTICGSQSKTLTITAIPGFSLANAVWYSSTNGISYNPIVPAALGATYTTPALTATTYYRAVLNNGAAAECVHSDVTISASNPLVDARHDGVRCGAGTVNLSVDAPVGTVRWYTSINASIGSAVATGLTYTTPSLSATTTYYVGLTIGTCEGDRQPVVATVNLGTLTLDPLQVVCNGVPATLQVNSPLASFDTYVWTGSGIANLYTSLSPDVLYVPGASATTLYYKSTNPGLAVFTCTADKPGCTTGTSKDSIYVQTSGATMASTPDSICISGNAAVRLVPATPYGVNWFSSTDNISYLPAVGSTAASTPFGFTLTTAPIENTYFKAEVRNSANGLCYTSAPNFKLNYIKPVLLTTVPGTRCSDGVVQLSATVAGGTLVNWYLTASGGTPTTGATYSTPVITETTTFYVSASIGSCQTSRTAVTATVEAAPAFTISGDQTICANDFATYTVTSDVGDYTSYIWTEYNTTTQVKSTPTNLYTSLSPDVPYVPGSSASTVYARRLPPLTPVTKIYRCDASNSTTQCASFAISSFSVQPASTTINPVTPLCINGQTTLSLSNAGPYGPGTIQWRKSTDDINYADVPAAIGITYLTPVQATTRYYQAQIKNGAGDVCFTTATQIVSVANPQVLTTTPGSRCGTGVVQLGATSTVGSTLSWYSVPTGGTDLGFSYAPVAVTGFNADIVANGIGLPATTTTADADGISNYLLDGTFQINALAALPSYYLPSNQVINSAANASMQFILNNYSANNSLRLATTGATDTLKLVTPQTAREINLIGFSGSGLASITAVVQFSDNTSQTFTGLSVSDWYNATPFAAQGIGRCSATGPDGAAGATNPRLYPIALTISAGNYAKLVTGVKITRTSAGGIVNIMAMNIGTKSGTFTTPSIATTTTFYVEATEGTCNSGRTAVIADVSAAPALTLSSSNQSACINTIIPISITSNLANFDNYVWVPADSLYTDAAGLVPYVPGSSATTVYFHSSVLGSKTYTVNASGLGGCINSASTIVNNNPVAIAISATVTTICNSGFTALSATPIPGFVFTNLRWETSSDSINWTFTGATGGSFTPNLISSTTYFRALLLGGAGDTCSQAGVRILVNTPLVAIVAPNFRCGPGTVNLAAIGSAGASINWYTASVGGTLVAGGTNSFTTPPVSSDTSYYVAAFIGSCFSPTRTQVTATVTPGPALTIAASDSIVCNGVASTLTVTSTLSNFDSYVWTPASNLYTSLSPDVPYVSGASATTVYAKTTIPGRASYVCTATNSSDGCGNLDTVMVNTNPASISVTGSPTVICITGTSTLTVAPVAGFDLNSIVWQSSTDGIAPYADIVPAATGASYTSPVLSANAFYRAVLRNQAGAVCVNGDIAITVNNPQILTTIPATRCGTGTATLQATADLGSTIKWYTDTLSGTSVFTGGTFVTPVLSTTTKYYVSAGGSGAFSASVGKPAYNTTDGTNTTGAYIIFSAISTFTLNSVTIYPFGTGAGTITIALQNSAGTTLQTAVVNTVGNSTPIATVVPVNFVIPVGTDYRLVYSATSGGVTAMYRDFTLAATTFPYTLPGVVSITNSSLAGYYYYFYNWTVSSGCESLRYPVTVTVTPPPPLDVTPSLVVCNNVSTPLTVTSTLGNFDNYTWAPLTGLFEDAAGLTAYTGDNRATVYAKTTTAGSYTYVCTGANTTGSLCVDTASVIYTVLPSAVSIVSTPSAVCVSGSTVLSLSPAAPYGIQWQTSPDGIAPYTDLVGHTGIRDTTPVITANAFYAAQIKNGAGAVCLTPTFTVQVNNPAILTTTNGTRCGTGTVTLSATANAGSAVSWYTAATGGAPIEMPYSKVNVTGFNNDIVAGGVGSSSILGTTYPTIGVDGQLYSFIDNTYKYAAANALPTCFMPTNKLAPSLLTAGLTYEFQSYNGNNALSLANQSTTYTSPLPSSGTLTLATPASFGTLKVLYESVLNVGTFTVNATVTFTDASTQSFNNNPLVNWFTVSQPAYSGMGRTTPTGTIQCGSTPNMFELSLPISLANQSKQVQSITFSIPTVITTGTTPATVNYFHAMAVGGNAPAPIGSFTTPEISTTTTYYAAATAGGFGSQQTSSNGVPNVTTTTTNTGLLFDVYQDLLLNSVDVYSTAAGSVAIELINGAGVVIAGPVSNAVIASTIAIPQTLPLNWIIPAGTNYRIIVTSQTGALGYHTGVFPSPLGNGVGTITNGATLTGTTTLNYFIYNMRTSIGCASPRVPVTATVTTPPAISTTSSSSICNGQSKAITASSPTNPNYAYVWNGTLIGAPQTVTPTTTTNYHLVATDTSSGPNAGCVNTADVLITVNPVPTLPNVTPLIGDTICSGTTVNLQVTNPDVSVQADVQVGSGVATASTSGITPYDGFWEGAKKQYLFTAAELSAAGFVAGNLNAMKVTTATVLSVPLTNYTVSMGHTSAVDLSSGYVSTSFTTVYSTPAYTVQPGLNTHSFSTPFAWDGVSNVVMDICFDNDPTGTCTAGSGTCYSSAAVTTVTTTPFVSVRGNYGDASAPRTMCDGTFGTLTTSSDRPNFTFTGETANAAPATYVWTPGPLSGTSVNVTPSVTTTYTVLATNNFGCTSSGTTKIDVNATPQPSLTPGNQILCAGQSVLFSLAPDPAYPTGYPVGTLVDWNNGAYTNTPPSFTVSSNDGDASAVVKLSSAFGGCTVATTVRTVEVRNVAGNVSTTPTSCTSSSGTITVNATAGLAPYRYVINLGASTVKDTTSASATYTLTDRPAGSYDVFIYDNADLSHGGPSCNSSALSAVVVAPSGPAATASVIQHETCPLAGNGSASVAIVGGTAPLTIVWSGGTMSVDHLTVTNLTPGGYNVTVTDANGCSSTSGVTINPGTGVTITAVITPVSCTGASDGTIVTTVTNGSGTYSYEWLANDQVTLLGVIVPDLTGAPGDTYYVQVTDAVTGCIKISPAFVVTEPNTISVTGFSPSHALEGASVIVTGTGFTQATAVDFGGTPAVTYVINNDGQITATVPVGAITGVITVTQGACGSASSSGTFTVDVPSFATLELRLFIQGFYLVADGVNTIDGINPITVSQMVPSLFFNGMSASDAEVDSVFIELHDPLSPSTVLAAQMAVVDTGGHLTVQFPASVIGGDYYIAMVHRNTTQTWSAQAVSITTSNTNYDFSGSSSMAFADGFSANAPMIEVEPGVWAMCSGDIFKDDVLDIFDQIDLDNDATNGNFGYLPTDLTGEGVVDIFDQIILDNNTFNLIYSQHP